MALISPKMFPLLFNAQFFGAEAASLFPHAVPYEGFILVFMVLLVISAWLIGYVWAWLYNELAKVF